MRHAAVVCALEQGVRHCRISCVRMKRETLQNRCIRMQRETLQNKVYQNEVRDTAVVCARGRSA